MIDLPLPAAGVPLTKGEAATYGIDTIRHPITRMPIARSLNALPIEQQAREHLQIIRMR
jgi:hypothetical protein